MIDNNKQLSCAHFGHSKVKADGTCRECGAQVREPDDQFGDANKMMEIARGIRDGSFPPEDLEKVLRENGWATPEEHERLKKMESYRKEDKISFDALRENRNALERECEALKARADKWDSFEKAMKESGHDARMAIVNMFFTDRSAIEKDRDAWKEVARKAIEALKAKISLEGRDRLPAKLDGALTWVENDMFAAKMADESLAAFSEMEGREKSPRDGKGVEEK